MLNITISRALFPAVTVTVVRDRKIRTALRTNQLAGFVTVSSWKKIKADIKNVIKRGGHHACFHATMLTGTVIKVTFGDLCGQQIATDKRDYFPMRRVISHRVRLSLIVYSSTSQKDGFKYPALLINIFIL